MKAWVVVAVVAVAGRAAGQEYVSPYTVKFTHPVAELLADIEKGPRGDRKAESSVPHAEWYSKAIERRWGAWGPPAVHYPAPTGVSNKSAAWQRERVIAVALRYKGYEYQHHHIPDWNPPTGWPWKEVSVGHNGKGVDCSNFTSFVYNQGFGIKPNSGIGEQAEQTTIPGPGGKAVKAERVEMPATYAAAVKAFKTGDLLFIRGKPGGEVTHVVLWVGPIGQSPTGVPLVLDSTGGGHKDSNGVAIPAGVQLRPFTESSWYYKSASHAHRLITGD